MIAFVLKAFAFSSVKSLIYKLFVPPALRKGYSPTEKQRKAAVVMFIATNVCYAFYLVKDFMRTRDQGRWWFTDRKLRADIPDTEHLSEETAIVLASAYGPAAVEEADLAVEAVFDSYRFHDKDSQWHPSMGGAPPQ